MIRARLASGELTTYIGPDPNGGHVIRTDNGDMHTIDDFTAEFGPIPEQWMTGIHQGPGPYGIASWPTIDDARKYQAGQLHSYGRIVPVGRIIHHQGMYVLADTTGKPLKVEG